MENKKILNENKYSVIDVGTNNILLLLAAKINNHLEIIHRDSNISALGKNMKNGILAENALVRTKDILKDNIKFSKLYTKNIIVIGTSCSREASNIYILSKWLKKKYNLKYNIISGMKEAYLNGLANIHEFPDKNEIILFDVGGGSTEFTYLKNGQIIAKQSLRLGIRRLQNLHNNDFGNKIIKTREILKELDLPKLAKPEIIGIGGTVTSLSAIKNNLKKYDGNIVHKSIITKNELYDLLHKISKLSCETLATLIPFDPKRSDIILTGTLIVREIIDYFKVDKFTVSDKGLQFGVLFQNEEEIKAML
jgi:exopolyphosphatase/guanosine-5'-triphosphate,3'-diphosphate pyrophosphatase